VRINLVPGCRGPQAEEPVLSLELPSQEPGKTGWPPTPGPGPEHGPRAPHRGKCHLSIKLLPEIVCLSVYKLLAAVKKYSTY